MTGQIPGERLEWARLVRQVMRKNESDFERAWKDLLDYWFSTAKNDGWSQEEVARHYLALREVERREAKI